MAAASSGALTDIGAGLAAGGLAGSLFGGSKAKAPDISGLLNTINQGATRQNQIATALPGQLAPLNAQYQTGINSAINNAQAQRQQSASDFLKSLGQTQTLAGQDTTKLLTEQAYQNVPEAENAAREAAAATGGLQRGAAAELLAQPSFQAAQAVRQGTTALDLQQQQQRADALNKINTMDNNFIQQTLGIDKDTLTALYSTGRQDLIDEANQLLGISQTQTAQTLGAQQFGISGDIAANAANAAANQGTFQGLTRLGGTLIGAGMAGPAGAAAGSTLASTLAPQPAPVPTIPSLNLTNPNLGYSGYATPGYGTPVNPLGGNNALLQALLAGQNPNYGG